MSTTGIWHGITIATLYCTTMCGYHSAEKVVTLAIA